MVLSLKLILFCTHCNSIRAKCIIPKHKLRAPAVRLSDKWAEMGRRLSPPLSVLFMWFSITPKAPTAYLRVCNKSFTKPELKSNTNCLWGGGGANRCVIYIMQSPHNHSNYMHTKLWLALKPTEHVACFSPSEPALCRVPSFLHSLVKYAAISLNPSGGTPAE